MSRTLFPEWRLTRKQYDRLIEQGVFHEDDPIELVDGCLIVREPQNTPHAIVIELVMDALRNALGAGWRVRPGLPLALDRLSEPEPDVSVVRGAPRDSLTDHPSSPNLVVEIADSSLRFDRTIKAMAYARAGVPDYWILNLRQRVVEIHREPMRAGRRSRYVSVIVARPGEAISPLVAPDARIAVAALLP
jgi:Uma2 family endonuclease